MRKWAQREDVVCERKMDAAFMLRAVCDIIHFQWHKGRLNLPVLKAAEVIERNEGNISTTGSQKKFFNKLEPLLPHESKLSKSGGIVKMWEINEPLYHTKPQMVSASQWLYWGWDELLWSAGSELELACCKKHRWFSSQHIRAATNTYSNQCLIFQVFS